MSTCINKYVVDGCIKVVGNDGRNNNNITKIFKIKYLLIWYNSSGIH